MVEKDQMVKLVVHRCHYELGTFVAKKRLEIAKQTGLKEDYVGKKGETKEQKWHRRRMGSVAELAVARVLNRYWWSLEPYGPSVEADVGNVVQVRHTLAHNYHLLAGEDEIDSKQAYVHVTGDWEDLWVRGWCVPREIEREYHNGTAIITGASRREGPKGPYYLVHPSQLHPFETLRFWHKEGMEDFIG